MEHVKTSTCSCSPRRQSGLSLVSGSVCYWNRTTKGKEQFAWITVDWTPWALFKKRDSFPIASPIFALGLELRHAVYCSGTCRHCKVVWINNAANVSAPVIKLLGVTTMGLIYKENGNVSWQRRVQIKQLAWSMAEQQIGHRKLRLVLSALFPALSWRSPSVAKIMIHATLPRNCVKHANVRKRKADCKQSSYMYESSVFFSLCRMAQVSLKHFIGIDPTWKQYSEWWIKITQVRYMTCTVLCSLVNGKRNIGVQNKMN